MSCARGCCPTQADHYRSLVVRPAPSAASQREARLGRDLDAYKRLRESGSQPKTFAGAAALEREATSHFEVATGQVLGDKRLVREVEHAQKYLPPDAA